MARNIITGIDVGTNQVKVVITEVTKENGKTATRVIGVGLAESKGLRHGYIIHSRDVTESIKIAVGKAEKESGVSVRQAFVGIGGVGLSSSVSSASCIVSRADLEITDLDIAKVQEICEHDLPTGLIQNRKILHAIPLSYKIDGKIVLAKSPIGMKGSKLEVRMLFVTCLETHLYDLLEAVEMAGVEVVDSLAAPIAASFVTLSKQQKMAGCVLANIGAETISVVVFENNIPVSLEVFSTGGTDITNDIALGLKIPLEEAEGIKLGAVGPGSFSKKKLDDIIHARISDMLELIENHLKKIGRNGLLPAGIFITGGGSGVHSMEEMAKTALKLPSRMASLNLTDAKNNFKDSTWAVAYGLCVLGASREEIVNIGVRDTMKKSGQKIFGWLKQFLP